jgi:hypothetical protein
MIYRRRALQRRLDELRDVPDGNAVGKLAERFNRAGVYGDLCGLRSFQDNGAMYTELNVHVAEYFGAAYRKSLATKA